MQVDSRLPQGLCVRGPADFDRRPLPVVDGREPPCPRDGSERNPAARDAPDGPSVRRRPAAPGTAIRCLRLALMVLVALGLYMVARWVDEALVTQLSLTSTPANDWILQATVVTAIVVYIVLMAVPFMPSAEIGLCLLMLFGARIAVVVYAGTVIALTLSFLIGRLIPAPALAHGLRLLGLSRLEALVRRWAALPPSQAISLLVRDAPTGAIPLLVRHRFLALALVFNLPGNTLIGGGGGIALAAGISRLFPLPLYLLTVALAVAPVPLVVFLAGKA